MRVKHERLCVHRFHDVTLFIPETHNLCAVLQTMERFTLFTGGWGWFEGKAAMAGLSGRGIKRNFIVCLWRIRFVHFVAFRGRPSIRYRSPFTSLHPESLSAE